MRGLSCYFFGGQARIALKLWEIWAVMGPVKRGKNLRY
jgi:hypothetical protein